jgi:hypothetical protein
VPQARTVTFEVRAADFGGELSLAVGYPRIWELPLVPRDLSIGADAWLTLAEQDTTAPAPRTFVATATEAGPARVLARLGEDGPVLAAATVSSFHFASATETAESSVVEVLADGTRVVQIGYVIDGRIPADLSIWLRLYVTDAVFANGDTWYHLTAADFDANGMARLMILKAPGRGTAFVCHWIKPFGSRDGSPDGDAAAGNATPPPDPETPVSPELVAGSDPAQQPAGAGQ